MTQPRRESRGHGGGQHRMPLHVGAAPTFFRAKVREAVLPEDFLLSYDERQSCSLYAFARQVGIRWPFGGSAPVRPVFSLRGLAAIEGRAALYHCNVPLCVKALPGPDSHLTLGTRSDDIADRAMKGRPRQSPRCDGGGSPGPRKLRGPGRSGISSNTKDGGNHAHTGGSRMGTVGATVTRRAR